MNDSPNLAECSHYSLPEKYDQLKAMYEEQRQSIEALETAICEAGRQQLVAEFESLEMNQILSATADPIWAVREDGVVIRANNAMLKVLKKDKSEVVGQHCWDLIHYGCCEGGTCPRENIKSGKNQEFEFFLDGEYYSLVTSPLVTIVGTAAIVGHFRNISIRKQAEQQLEELNKKLSEAANMDGLTHIANRRSFDTRYQQEWSRHKRNNMSLSLVIIDIDFFKKYNDYYGHSVGDDCLIKVASAIKSAVKRPVDLAARYGGEEFVLLLPETPLEGALFVAQRTAEIIAELKLAHHESEVSDYVTISQGVASVVPDEDLDPVNLINLADKALYSAKESGRNCFTSHQSLK